jgi:hypothetical protein
MATGVWVTFWVTSKFERGLSKQIKHVGRLCDCPHPQFPEGELFKNSRIHEFANT